MKVLVYDFRWKNENACAIEGAGTSGNFENKFGRKPLAIGEKISLEICSPVRCAGSVENGIWKPCPKNSTGKPKCDYCRAIEGNFVFTAFDGFNESSLAPGDLEKISGTHVVYFALFEKNLVKIGVSKLERKIMRQLEQGSHATLFVAETPDGIAARQIESLVRKSGFADKIKSSEKQNFLRPEISADAAETELRQIFAEKKSALAESPHFENFLLPEPEFFCWENFYHTREISAAPHVVKLAENDWISGEIVAWKGSFVVIRTNFETGKNPPAAEFVAIDAKNLRGHEIEFDEKPAGLKMEAALQNSLF
ncbi:DUF2797 domain-containing protein [bacterium]|jgi:hypothetical protein|nr:DUF2797 domain-containing protein [bacterium]MBT6831591.1 DUF2797 domain-containing protein [bacterium]MBT6995886.1 DUF2797 domain-containing protein [bacterium]MBT7772660.1 DUF2797 domain-containing protein [bacterium]